MQSSMNTQVRIVGAVEGVWTDYGSYGWIDAAQAHAAYCGLANNSSVQVRDANDPSRPMATFNLERVVTYRVTNPRQGEA